MTRFPAAVKRKRGTHAERFAELLGAGHELVTGNKLVFVERKVVASGPGAWRFDQARAISKLHAELTAKIYRLGAIAS